MGDTENTRLAQKKSFWEGLKAEFSKIIWPDTETVVRETRSVTAASVVLRLLIAALDTVMVFLLHFAI